MRERNAYISTVLLRDYPRLRENGFVLSGEQETREIMDEMAIPPEENATAMLQAFVDKKTVLDPNGFAATGDLFDAFVSFCGGAQLYSSMQMFSASFAALTADVCKPKYAYTKDSKRKHGYIGIRIIERIGIPLSQVGSIRQKP